MAPSSRIVGHYSRVLRSAPLAIRITTGTEDLPAAVLQNQHNDTSQSFGTLGASAKPPAPDWTSCAAPGSLAKSYLIAYRASLRGDHCSTSNMYAPAEVHINTLTLHFDIYKYYKLSRAEVLLSRGYSP